MGSSQHDIVRIGKFISDTIEHMQQQLQSFHVFIQQKKGYSHQYFPQPHHGGSHH